MTDVELFHQSYVSSNLLQPSSFDWSTPPFLPTSEPHRSKTQGTPSGPEVRRSWNSGLCVASFSVSLPSRVPHLWWPPPPYSVSSHRHLPPFPIPLAPWLSLRASLPTHRLIYCCLHCPQFLLSVYRPCCLNWAATLRISYGSSSLWAPPLRSTSHNMGPFPVHPPPSLYSNQFGVIPKGGRPGKWCLSVNLSFPPGRSVNDGINLDDCSLFYAKEDQAISFILQLSRVTLLVRVDIWDAYCL